jgi:hypothetical protein
MPPARLTRKPLIEHLGSDQIDGIEGTTADLRIGAVFRPVGRPAPEGQQGHARDRQAHGQRRNPDGIFVVKPGDYLLVRLLSRSICPPTSSHTSGPAPP